MGIALVRLPALKLNLILFTGPISRSDILRFYGEIDAADPANEPRWITHVSEDADFSGLPVDAFPQLKQILLPKLKRLLQNPDYRDAIVCNSEQCEMVANFWRNYVERELDYISPPETFTNLKDACDWLDLPNAGCEEVAETVRGQGRVETRPRS